MFFFFLRGLMTAGGDGLFEVAGQLIWCREREHLSIRMRSRPISTCRCRRAPAVNVRLLYCLMLLGIVAMLVFTWIHFV